jgi:hypothetical protein
VRHQKYLIYISIFIYTISPVWCLDRLLNQQDQIIELEQFKGKYLVLEWLNFSCHMLRGHYENLHIQRAQSKLKKMGATWISVLSQGKGQPSYFSNRSELQNALNHYSWNGDHALRDEQGIWGQHFLAKKTPYFLLINPKGDIIYRGALDESNPFTHNEKSLEKAKNFLAMAMEQDRRGEKVKVPFSQSYGCPIKYGEKLNVIGGN